MIRASVEFRVRYAETDQMGFVYYGNYAQYFEIGRVEALKKVGVSYRALEESGIRLPVKELHIEYIKAAKYDDLIRVTTTIQNMPTNRIVFDYIIERDRDVLVKGQTTLFFMNEQGKACRPHADFLNQLKPFFS
ncbi:MAG: acyl-CoA thioesterase [Bacteroidetes bacterium]|nr:MAG: acyl-CoA thioesterase [Bacteroidota bacterium]MBL1144293.1 acyl-CoA thioesterase [Bacteroidota bacterium]NOG57090.1 acyl-CoA thioesterase [Bacteroidota bacterium]